MTTADRSEVERVIAALTDAWGPDQDAIALIRSLAKDAGRLDWLHDNEAALESHRERFGADGGWTIWWNVVKCGKSISGHPLGDPRAAIDAAMARKEGGGG
jgi:hypothetical protein